MLPRYRHRRGPYALAEPSPARGIVRRLVALAIVLLAVYFIGKWTLGALGIGNSLERKAVQLDVEARSNVTVSLEGGLMQRPDDRLKLWPDDRVVSNAGGNAVLTYFDGTVIRIDEQSEITIIESSKGSKESEIGAHLSRGALWTRTPGNEAFSGAIARWIVTENYIARLPSDADVVLGARSVLVFSADGDGVTVETADAEPIQIGEGQQLSVPEDGAFDGDLRRYRSAMDPLAVRRAFIEESRAMGGTATGSGSAEETDPIALDLITVEAPVDNQTVTGSTVRVQGKVGARVERVRVSGYPATINRQQATYTQELAMPTTDTFTIRVEALDRTGVVVEQQERTVRPRAAATATTPSVTSPGKNGEIVRTSAQEIEIRGTAPAGTTAIYVNDYKLQLFRAGDVDWSYLASLRLSNLKQGENVFNVFAEDATGGRSAPATLTIVIGETGPTTPAAGATSSASSVPSVSETTLPTNAPLKPGTITVTSPTPGATATHTGTGFLLEGTTIAETASVWVNGYQLKLYTPGKTFWNYWATAAYGTLKPGTNQYRIVTRDKENQILDVFTYTVEYTP
jgi:hypothetical protein